MRILIKSLWLFFLGAFLSFLLASIFEKLPFAPEGSFAVSQSSIIIISIFFTVIYIVSRSGSTWGSFQRSLPKPPEWALLKELGSAIFPLFAFALGFLSLDLGTGRLSRGESLELLVLFGGIGILFGGLGIFLTLSIARPYVSIASFSALVLLGIALVPWQESLWPANPFSVFFLGPSAKNLVYLPLWGFLVGGWTAFFLLLSLWKLKSSDRN